RDLVAPALGPSQEIIGCASREILSGPDAAISECDQHGGRNPRNIVKRLLEAQHCSSRSGETLLGCLRFRSNGERGVGFHVGRPVRISMHATLALICLMGG